MMFVSLKDNFAREESLCLLYVPFSHHRSLASQLSTEADKHRGAGFVSRARDRHRSFRETTLRHFGLTGLTNDAFSHSDTSTVLPQRLCSLAKLSSKLTNIRCVIHGSIQTGLKDCLSLPVHQGSTIGGGTSPLYSQRQRITSSANGMKRSTLPVSQMGVASFESVVNVVWMDEKLYLCNLLIFSVVNIRYLHQGCTLKCN